MGSEWELERITNLHRPIDLCRMYVNATADADKLRAENARLREAVENLTQELQRCATDGGGYSCTVVDEARAALKGTP